MLLLVFTGSGNTGHILILLHHDDEMMCNRRQKAGSFWHEGYFNAAYMDP
jgi:hypothetical protein